MLFGLSSAVLRQVKAQSAKAVPFGFPGEYGDDGVFLIRLIAVNGNKQIICAVTLQNRRNAFNCQVLFFHVRTFFR